MLSIRRTGRILRTGWRARLRQLQLEQAAIVFISELQDYRIGCLLRENITQAQDFVAELLDVLTTDARGLRLRYPE